MTSDGTLCTPDSTVTLVCLPVYLHLNVYVCVSVCLAIVTLLSLLSSFRSSPSFPPQELLPLVLMFELPVMVQVNPDPSSPAIQHISHTYNISVAFRQRSRLYGTTGVVRGSQNNADNVKVGCVTYVRPTSML